MSAHAGNSERTSGTMTRRVRVLAGKDILFDEEDFFWDYHEWSEEAAELLAKEDGLPGINERQWMVIRFLREFYSQNGRAPLNRQLKKGTGLTMLELEELFPEGIKRGARRLAGLPNPKHCA